MEVVLAVLLVAGIGVAAARVRATRAQVRRKEQLERFLTTLRDTRGERSLVAVEGATTMTAATPGAASFEVEAPHDLPTFADVGGMEQLKQELRDTVGLLREHRERASAYGIAFNGLLLHGPPGTGKSHLARAVAGEFGMNLLHVSTGDLVEGIVGASARNVERAFEAAAANRPCVLFLDEFDSVAQRRDSAGHAEERRTVNQLLVALEAYQDDPDVLVVAATNDLEHLDPAVVRPGRFDRHVRVDLPDHAARRAILGVHLADRPSADETIDLDDLAARTSGRTAAELAHLVEQAALLAFREAAETGETVRISAPHLDTALQGLGGADRPTVEQWGWDDLVLPDRVLAELRQIETLLAEPDLAAQVGVEPPRGVLLVGPPGTGKTTIARVLAAQSRCSFYPVSAADVSSRWHGESERSIKRLFERARANRPSIVFIDEIDALGRARGGPGTEVSDRQLTQLLTEIDGLGDRSGILVLAATNRPEILDPALTRGGRLSRVIELPLPEVHDRLRLLEAFTRRMPTVGIDLRKVAEATDSMSGADLEAICQQAGLHALVRTRDAGDPEAAVEVLATDMARAILDRRGER